MIHFQALNGKKAGTGWVARRFPVRIGRAAETDICLDEPGIWDEHLRINLRSDRSVEASVAEQALASINGQPVREAILHSGDIIELGALQLRFGLSPARLRSFAWRELLTWIALGLLCLGQVGLAYYLC